ncbi:hypothetical protein D5F01_LYC02951 [Larimichthys crocea]|uniref:TNFR-Cys domain-containing protein n=1 Tax=Larimichthys crocea TaxID=215358 RepID=A0A6G0J4R1_LARCR|nr:hypothetical protein D5F01_LYC02951 [Larimichthys crocea]
MFTLTFYELVHLDASEKICPKGQRVGQNGRCVTCHKGTYQITNNYSGRCQGTCTKCDEESGSFTIKECTEENNCRICKSVRTPGTTKSDVICNNTYATTQPTPTKTISIIKLLTSHRPQEGTENQKIHSTTTTTTATTTKSSSASGHPATPNDKVQPSYPSTTGNYIGMALLIFGIAGLLVLTAVTCKLHITPYLEKQPAEAKNESCRRPVEESGDGSLSPLKPNAEEP